MRSPLLAPILTAVVCLLAACPAAAAILSADWQAPGDGLLTQDTIAELEWLDVTETERYSYNFVLGELAGGGQFEGFRVATQAELEALTLNAGIAPGNLTSNYLPVETLVALVGCTRGCGGDDGAFGRYASSSNAGSHDIWTIRLDSRTSSGVSEWAGSIADDTVLRIYGTWLVRDFSPVPVDRTTWGRLKILIP